MKIMDILLYLKHNLKEKVISMKKIICLIAAMLLIAGCSAGNQSEKAGDVSSDSTKSAASDMTVSENVDSDATEESIADADLSDEEVLSRLEGLYVTSEYIETFKETKSIKSVYRMTPILYFQEIEGKHFVMPGDFHQGSENLAVVAVDEIEGGKYLVKTEKGSYVGECEFIYTPGEGPVECRVNGSAELLSTNGEFISFEHFESFGELDREMSEIVFEGIEDVEFDGDKVYANINGERCLLSFADDYVGLGTGRINVSSYDGAFFVGGETDTESEIMCYKCNDSSVTLTDLDGNVVVTLK